MKNYTIKKEIKEDSKDWKPLIRKIDIMKIAILSKGDCGFNVKPFTYLRPFFTVRKSIPKISMEAQRTEGSQRNLEQKNYCGMCHLMQFLIVLQRHINKNKQIKQLGADRIETHGTMDRIKDPDPNQSLDF